MTAKPAKATASTSEAASLQGTIVDASDPAALREAIELAFNYRGDVTITTTHGDAIEGYLFDRHTDSATGELFVRMLPTNSDEKIAIAVRDIASLAFTGRDTASGKSFQNWIQKYAQKKLAGEAASIESESLDEA